MVATYLNEEHGYKRGKALTNGARKNYLGSAKHSRLNTIRIKHRGAKPSACHKPERSHTPPHIT